MAQVFISYSSKTRGFALFLQQQLKNINIEAWVDQISIRKSYEWELELDKGLEDCDCMIVIISPAATKSEWVTEEWQYAIREKKPIIPILFYETENIPKELSRIQHIDFRDKFRVETLLNTVSYRLGLKPRLVPDDAPKLTQEMIRTLYYSWNPDEKTNALEQLGKEKDEHAIPAIGFILLEDADPNLRIQASKTFQDIGSKKAVPYLRSALKDENPSVRNSAVKRLGSVGGSDSIDDIASALNDEHSLVRGGAVKALAEIGNEQAARHLIYHHIEVKQSENERGILDTVTKLGAIAVPVLIENLKDTDAHVRKTSALLLLHFRDPNAEQPLINLIENDTDVEVRRHALYALGAININRATPYLLEALDDEEPQIRMTGASILGEATQSDKIISRLEKALKDVDERVRRGAQNSLDKLYNKS